MRVQPANASFMHSRKIQKHCLLFGTCNMVVDPGCTKEEFMCEGPMHASISQRQLPGAGKPEKKKR